VAEDPGTTAGRSSGSAGPRSAEDAALQEALAAEHAAVWGFGVVGAAVPSDLRPPVDLARSAHRDVRDRVTALLADRGAEPVAPLAAYALPFQVRTAADAAALADTLESGVATAWAWVLDQAVERSTRELAVGVLSDSEVRAVLWRGQAGQTTVTSAFPGLPPS
jgi:uncharacterized protein DUF4439